MIFTFISENNYALYWRIHHNPLLTPVYCLIRELS